MPASSNTWRARERRRRHSLQDIGRRIAELRAGLLKTQEQLAEKLEVTPRYVQMVKGGQENLTVKSLATLPGALGVLCRNTADPNAERSRALDWRLTQGNSTAVAPATRVVTG